MIKLKYLTPLFLFGLYVISNLHLALSNPVTACNGYPKLCEKKYNEISFLATHYSQSYKKSAQFLLFDSLNINHQTRPLNQQLHEGIRAFVLPLWKQANHKLAVCHHLTEEIRDSMTFSFCNKAKNLKTACQALLANPQPCSLDPAQVELAALLREVKTFLDQEPHEVITLFLENYTDDPSLIRKVFRASGLWSELYSPPADGQWPTLTQMIQAKKRIVVFQDNRTEQKGSVPSPRDPILSQNSFFWSSSYSFNSIEEIKEDGDHFRIHTSADPTQGKMWILQHFITPSGTSREARVVNHSSLLRRRINGYQVIGRNPNFIWVNFYQFPRNVGAFELVKELNELN